MLFWSDWGNKAPRIERCSMSGDHRVVIVKIDDALDGEWPNGLTLDYQLLRVYWVDAKSVSSVTNLHRVPANNFSNVLKIFR